MSPKIIAVVVTYNRKELLLKNLDGILNQTRPLDKIIIVDNNSSDGTQDFLTEKGYLDRKNVIYMLLPDNLGSAGGFHRGMHRAQEEGADWFWLLDDDICPRPDCLSALLKYENISKCLGPFRVQQDGKKVFSESFFDTSTGICTSVDTFNFDPKREVVAMTTCSFEGMLIHKDVVSRIGFPDERFFMVNDDTAYGFLASLHTNIFCVRKAVMERMLPVKSRMSNMAAYYLVRNQFLVKKHLKKYKLFRWPFFYTVLIMLMLHLSIIGPVRNRSMLMPWYVAQGLYNGLRGRFGK